MGVATDQVAVIKLILAIDASTNHYQWKYILQARK